MTQTEQAVNYSLRTLAPEIFPITSVDRVRRAVALIASWNGAGEGYTAARLERELWAEVLDAIAGCNAQAGYLAAEALRTQEIELPRH